MNFLKVGSLMAKYGQLSPTQITIDVAKDIADALGYEIPISDDLLSQITSVLAEDDIDKLADMASHPAVVAKIVTMLATKQQDVEGLIEPLNLITCPHCGEYVST